jgi:hypothetical protein
MQPPVVLIQLVSSLTEPPVQIVSAVNGKGLSDAIECRSDPSEHRPPRQVSPVQIESEMIQTNIGEALEHDVKCGALLSNKEGRSPGGGEMC